MLKLGNLRRVFNKVDVYKGAAKCRKDHDG